MYIYKYIYMLRNKHTHKGEGNGFYHNYFKSDCKNIDSL